MSQPFNFHNMRLLFCHSTVNLFSCYVASSYMKVNNKISATTCRMFESFPVFHITCIPGCGRILNKTRRLAYAVFIYLFLSFVFSVAPFGILTKYTFSYYIIYKHISHKIWRMWLHGVFVAIDKVAVLHHSIPSVHS